MQEIPGTQGRAGWRCLGAEGKEGREEEEQAQEAGARWPGPERPLLPRVRKGGTASSFPREHAPRRTAPNPSLLLCQEGDCELRAVKHPSSIPLERAHSFPLLFYSAAALTAQGGTTPSEREAGTEPAQTSYKCQSQRRESRNTPNISHLLSQGHVFLPWLQHRARVPRGAVILLGHCGHQSQQPRLHCLRRHRNIHLLHKALPRPPQGH